MSAQAETKADRSQDEVIIDEFLSAMKEGDSEDVLKKAFKILSKGQDYAHVSADVLCRVSENGDLKLKPTKAEVVEIIRQVKADKKDEGEIYEGEFIKIIKQLKEPTVVDQLKKIHGILCSADKKKVVLHGKSGAGKTWMAKRIADRAVGQGKFHIALWIYPKRDLRESIAYQLSMLSAFNEWKAKEEQKEKDKRAKQGKSEEDEKNEKRKKLEKMICEALKEKNVLLIFDEEESGMKVEKFLSEGSDFHNLLAVGELKTHKVLRTSRNHKSSEDEIGIMVRPLTRDESISLVGDVDGSVEKKELAEFFIDKTGRLPTEVLIIAKTVRYLELQKLQSVKKMILENESCSVTQLLINEYKLLPRSILIDCYSSETSKKHFLHQRLVTYNELISYWIMEGHLEMSQFDRIEDAYEKGHRVLMDLIDCGLLKTLEAGHVVPSGQKFEFDIHERHKFFREIQLGLAKTFDNRLGNIAVADGMIRTITSDHDGSNLLTLLLDGNLFGEVPDSFSESYSELEILAIFNPTNKPFPLPIFKMHNLCLLILRGCEFLESIECIFQPKTSNLQRSETSSDPGPMSQCPCLLKMLTVLEISGPSSLNTIPDHVFKSMPHLRNLNFSSLELESLPKSFYDLTKLEILILRGCSRLKELGSLKTCKDLEVLDLSGATCIENLHDKSFSENKKLQILDLSQTNIEKLPLVRSLKHLKSLSLRDCRRLLRLRKIDSLKRLQVFDISGCERVENFADPSLENLVACEVLHASRTSIKVLPFNIGKVRQLYLRECSQLKELIPFQDVSCVEVLDLSGCEALEKINDKSFDNMKRLETLNLSKTKLNELPSLSKLVKLKHLHVRYCLKLAKLPGVEELPVLEYLDHSGTTLTPPPSFNPGNCRPCVIGPRSLEEFDEQQLLKHLGLTNINAKGEKWDPPQEVLEQWSISNCQQESNVNEEILGVPVNGIHFIQLLKMHPTILTKDRLSFCVFPTEAQPDKVSYGDELSLRDIYFTYFEPVSKKPERFLEIRGFNCSPPFLQELLEKAEFLVLTDNPFLSFLNLDGSHTATKVCWIERCNKMEHVFDKNFAEEFKNLEVLWVSDAMELTRMSSKEIGNMSFTSLKCLYLEYCPKLSVICSSFEQLQSLEILHVRYCGIPGTPFEDESAKLDRLTTLNLWGLPTLKKISCKLQSLRSLTVGQCPLLELVLSSTQGKKDEFGNLEILQIKFCDQLKCISESERVPLDLPKLLELELWALPELQKVALRTPALKILKVGQCPSLENVVDSGDVLENLEVLEVKSCAKVKTIIKGGGSTLGKLDEKELMPLPEAKSIGADHFPRLKKENCIIYGCPNLQDPFLGERLKDASEILESNDARNP